MGKSFIPPNQHFEVPNDVELKSLTPESFKTFKKSYGYKKHVIPAIKRSKNLKKQKLKQWLIGNWISLFTLLISVITLFVTLLK